MAHLLLADDIAISRETLARVLREAGHRVTAVGSGQEAVERAQAEPPDMAILDLGMPRMSGVEAAPAVKAACPGQFLPVLIVSGRALGAGELQEVLAAADDFLRKPFMPAEICARVEVWLRTRRLFDDKRRAAAVTPPAPPALGVGGRPRSRAALLERIEEEWRRSVRWNEPFALLLCDAPAPHRAGAPGDDAAQLVRAAAKAVRQMYVLGQSSASRLAILLPNTTPAGALGAAERLRAELRGRIPLCFGLALVPGRDIGGPEDLFRAAELALERACAEGPFSLCLHQHQGYLVQAP